MDSDGWIRDPKFLDTLCELGVPGGSEVKWKKYDSSGSGVVAESPLALPRCMGRQRPCDSQHCNVRNGGPCCVELKSHGLYARQNIIAWRPKHT